MQLLHSRHTKPLSMLLPLLAATEFVENSAFTFSAGRIASELRLSAVEFTLLLTAFATSTMLMVALQQVLSRRWGYRRYLLVSLSLVFGGALGSALSSSWKALVLFRLLEGFGSGALFTSSRILVVHLFAKPKRPAALRTYISGLFGITAVGPIFAALLFELGGGLATFMAPVPFAILAFIGVYLWMPPDAGLHRTPTRWTALPILVFAGAVFLIQISLAALRVDTHPHLLPSPLVALCGGALLSYFFLSQKHHSEPIISWQGLHHSGYLIGLSIYVLYYFVSNANNYLLPVFAEQVVGLPLQTVGLLGSFTAAITWITALLYLRWGRHVPQKQWIMAGSCLLLLLSCLWLFRAPATVNVAYLVPALIAKGMFNSLMVLPLAGHTFRELSDEHFGSGYQNKNLIRQFAIALGSTASAQQISQLQNAYSIAKGNEDVATIFVRHEELRCAVSNIYLLLATACGCMMLIIIFNRKLK